MRTTLEGVLGVGSPWKEKTALLELPEAVEEETEKEAAGFKVFLHLFVTPWLLEAFGGFLAFFCLTSGSGFTMNEAEDPELGVA